MTDNDTIISVETVAPCFMCSIVPNITDFCGDVSDSSFMISLFSSRSDLLQPPLSFSASRKKLNLSKATNFLISVQKIK